MPVRPLNPCRQPGCPNLGDCPVHGRTAARQAYDQARGERVYATPAWRRLIRPAVLTRDPVCTWGSLPRDGAAPGSCVEPSTDVAHVTSRERGGSDALENLRSEEHTSELQ